MVPFSDHLINPLTQGSVNFCIRVDSKYFGLCMAYMGHLWELFNLALVAIASI